MKNTIYHQIDNRYKKGDLLSVGIEDSYNIMVRLLGIAALPFSHCIILKGKCKRIYEIDIDGKIPAKIKEDLRDLEFDAVKFENGKWIKI